MHVGLYRQRSHNHHHILPFNLRRHFRLSKCMFNGGRYQTAESATLAIKHPLQRSKGNFLKNLVRGTTDQIFKIDMSANLAKISWLMRIQYFRTFYSPTSGRFFNSRLLFWSWHWIGDLDMLPEHFLSRFVSHMCWRFSPMIRIDFHDFDEGFEAGRRLMSAFFFCHYAVTLSNSK